MTDDGQRRDIATRFRAGNPGGPGRPKGSISLTTLIKRALAGTTLHGQETKDGRTVAEWLVDQMIAHAAAGNGSYMRDILARNDGPIPKPEVKRTGGAEIIAKAAEKAHARKRSRSRQPDGPAQ